MRGRLIKCVRNPGYVLKRIRERALKRLSGWFTGSGYYLQSEMDIHPDSTWFNREVVDATGGFYPRGEQHKRSIKLLNDFDHVRRDMLILLLRKVQECKVPGEMAELGVFQGLTARLLHHYLPERHLHLFDTFNGFDAEDIKNEKLETGFSFDQNKFRDTSVEGVKARINPVNDKVHFHVGYFPDTIAEDLKDRHFCFVHLDADLYEPIIAGLEFFYPRLSPGGCLVVHDYNAWLGARKAVDEFFKDKPSVVTVPMPDKSGSVVVFKPAASVYG